MSFAFNHKLLQNFDRVAFDFDFTLFRHQLSHEFANFIRENPYNQTFYIVTFRSHGMQDQIAMLLQMDKMVCDLSHFAEVVNISDEMYNAYEASKWSNVDLSLAFMDDIDLNEEELKLRDEARKHALAVHDWRHWKGKMCAEHGLQVLIDDMTHEVKPGCDAYGIRHYHPDDLVLPPIAAHRPQ